MKSDKWWSFQLKDKLVICFDLQHSKQVRPRDNDSLLGIFSRFASVFFFFSWHHGNNVNCWCRLYRARIRCSIIKLGHHWECAYPNLGEWEHMRFSVCLLGQVSIQKKGVLGFNIYMHEKKYWAWTWITEWAQANWNSSPKTCHWNVSQTPSVSITDRHLSQLLA